MKNVDITIYVLFVDFDLFIHVIVVDFGLYKVSLSRYTCYEKRRHHDSCPCG